MFREKYSLIGYIIEKIQNRYRLYGFFVAENKLVLYI